MNRSKNLKKKILPVNYHGIGRGFVSVSTTFLVTTPTETAKNIVIELFIIELVSILRMAIELVYSNIFTEYNFFLVKIYTVIFMQTLF